MANTKITNPELFNLGDSTSATQLPVMTTTQRIAMNAPPTLNIDYLVVAGGGGGGGSNYGYTAGGGGGAGGLLTNVSGTSLSLATGGSGYTITVGDGGIIGTPTSNGGNGYDSLFYNITSKGGSGGGSAYPSPTSPSTGGSGGGSNAYANTPGPGTPNQGFAGGAAYGSNAGNGSGGGGGSSAVGANGLVGTGGNGGNGTTNAITVSSGTGPYYAGGGGGGQWLWQYSGTPTPGTGGTGGGGAGGTSVGSAYDGNAGSANTGGGGGGGSAKYTDGPLSGVNGGLGGSGVVILRYTTSDIDSYTATGLTPTETIDGTDTILSFTTVGTGTITFTSSTPTGTISTGEMIFNSTTDKVEYFDGTKWYGITYELPSSSAPTQLDSTIPNFSYSANTAGRPNCRITSSVTGYYSTKTSTGFDVGKFYCEMKFLSSSAYASGRCGPGVGNDTMNLSSYLGTDANSAGLLVRPEMFLYNGSYVGSPGSGSYGNNGIVMMAFDADTRTFFMGYNGTWSALTGDPITGAGYVLPADVAPFYWGGWGYTTSDSIEFNFYGSDMAYTIPQGYITA